MKYVDPITYLAKELEKLYSEGNTQKNIAYMFNVDPSQISRITRGLR